MGGGGVQHGVLGHQPPGVRSMRLGSLLMKDVGQREDAMLNVLDESVHEIPNTIMPPTTIPNTALQGPLMSIFPTQTWQPAPFYDLQMLKLHRTRCLSAAVERLTLPVQVPIGGIMVPGTTVQGGFENDTALQQ